MKQKKGRQRRDIHGSAQNEDLGYIGEVLHDHGQRLLS